MSAAANRTPSVTFATLNPNGLNGRPKRCSLFRSLQRRDDGVDIIMLQETHAGSEEVVKGWLTEGAGPGLPWLGPYAWAPGTSSSRGVAVLVSNALQLDSFECIYKCSSGRVVGATLSLRGHDYLVYSVYAPSVASERAAFFSGPLRDALLDGVQRFPGATLVVGGDFNCIASVALDQVGGQVTTSRTVGFTEGLRGIMEEFGLVDTFRALHPTACTFTHRATTGETAARLDRILVHDSLEPHFLRADVRDGWPGDHRLARAQLGLPNAVPKGPGVWVFPSDLLADDTYLDSMRARFQTWFAARPTGATYTAAERWEAFKRYAQDRTRRYCMERGRTRHRYRKLLQRRAATAADRFARSPDSPTAANEWARVQRELQQQALADSRRAATFAKVVWEDWGETSTSWFHRLAEQRRADCTITHLDVPEPGVEPTVTVPLSTEAGRRIAIDSIADFYDGELADGLFRARPTCPDAQRTMLGSVDGRLSASDMAACEGELGEEGISAAELAGALKTCARGKTPGLDGLTYEFYRAFWDVVGEPLAEVFNEALTGGPDARLPDSMLSGLIVLVYKGAKAGPRTQARCYRPLTMLNCDYKLLAKALAIRFGRPLGSIIDTTQTAFVPGRWIGDNVLMHLEEVDYLETTRNPGVIAFVDFEKAYDVVSRDWLFMCMERMGFGPVALRWVRLLLTGTRARCQVNGFHSRDFQVLSGVAQGSPLSPVLYVIAAQPLAARLRHLHREGRLRGIGLPGGHAPLSHQHADDTTMHAHSLADLDVAIKHALQPFCDASASRAHPSKAGVMLLGRAAEEYEGQPVHAATGFRMIPRDKALRHLGIMIGPGEVGEHARAQTFLTISNGILRHIRHWSARALTHDGRTHVARQCLASKLVYHATFTRPPRDLLQRMASSVGSFVDGRDAVGGPARVVGHLPKHLGGRGVPNLARIIDSLQAGVVCRLLHPARHAWKALFAARLTALPDPCAGLRYVLAAGRPGLGLPSRLAGYIEGFRACCPHRLSLVTDLPAAHVLVEPLFGNPTLRAEGGHPVDPAAFPAAVAAGVRTVGSLRAALQAQPCPGQLQVELLALRALLPPSWRSLVSVTAPQVHNEWWEWPPGRQPGGLAEMVKVDGGAASAAVHMVLPDGALVPTLRRVPWPPPPDRPAGAPCLVVDLDAHPTVTPDEGTTRRSGGNGRAGGGGTAAAAGVARNAAGGPSGEEGEEQHLSGGDVLAAPRLYVVGPWEGGADAPFDPTRWGLSGTPLLASTTKQRTAALVQCDAAADRSAAAARSARGRPMRPAVWDPGGPGGLVQREARWVAAAAPSTLGRRSREATQAADPHLAASAAWMRNVRSRLHYAHRAGLREEQQQQLERGPERRRSAAPWAMHFDDPAGGLATPEQLPWAGVWARLHRTPAPRAHRFLAWRVLHAALPCAGWLASRQRPVTFAAAGGRAGSPHCHHVMCDGQVETLSHVLLECPVAQQVTGWACRLWQAITQQQPPPRSVQVFLAGDHSVWLPGQHAELWHILRTAVLYFLWANRCIGRVEGRGISALAVVAQVVQHLRARMREDALRAFSHMREYDVLGGRWLPHRSTLCPTAFRARWTHRGVLCTVDDTISGPRSVCIRLTLVHPVQPPSSAGLGGPAGCHGGGAVLHGSGAGMPD